MLNRVATSVAMYNTRRTYERPPDVRRWPDDFPESLFSGATPTSLAISPRLSFPNSGNLARIVLMVTGPVPLTDLMISTLRALAVSASTHLAKRHWASEPCLYKSNVAVGLTQPTRNSAQPQKGIQKCFLNQLLTKFKTVADTFASSNVAVVTSMLPTIGISHPLLSYGGSNLVINLVSIGIVLSLARGAASTDESPLSDQRDRHRIQPHFQSQASSSATTASAVERFVASGTE